MRVVALDRDVVVGEREQVADIGIQAQRRQRPRRARQLLARLLEVVRIQVRIAQRVHEIADAQAGGLRHHVGQQRVAGDVERHAEEDVAAALVQLAAELAVDHVELEQAVARHQRHLRQFRHVPGADHQAPRVGIALDFVHQPLHLVDLAAVGAGPAPPLLAVHRAEFALRVGPLVPDADLVVLEVGDVGFALQEPQQLVHDRAQVQLLGGHQREAGVEIEAHLPAEHAARAGAGAVGFLRAVLEHVAQQVQVGLHGVASTATGSGCNTGARRERHSRNRPSRISGVLRIWPMVSQWNAR